jgi:hypothetical protein
MIIIFLVKFAKPKTDTLLSLENVDSARAQLAVSVTVVSLATGSPPRKRLFFCTSFNSV